MNKSKGAAEHRFSRSWSWWSGQPRFAPGSRYKENFEHPTAGDADKRNLAENNLQRRTRDPARFSIRALSELDARPAGASGAPRENLEFLQRRRGLGGSPVFSTALVAPNASGGSSRSVALEPLYAERRYQGLEQQRIDKGKEHFAGTGRTYPDWVARSRQGDGSYKTIAFDLKVPLYKPGTFMQQFYQPPDGARGIKQEFEQRRERMPAHTEQRLVFDLVSGNHNYKVSKQAIRDFADAHRDSSGQFVADSAQFLYRREIKDKSGAFPRGTGRYEVKMSKPIPLNPAPAAAASSMGSSSSPGSMLAGVGGASSSTLRTASSSAASSMPPPLAVPPPPGIRPTPSVPAQSSSSRPPGSLSLSSMASGVHFPTAPAPHQPPPSLSANSTGARQSTTSSSTSALPRHVSTASSTGKGGQGPS
ncbi:hypothetical protein ISN75_09980 [Dyella marensis]|uniref:hypothetical protein n=1 Tax=Dyella marensis TaxID=500610 RepID=UPI0031D8E97B